MIAPADLIADIDGALDLTGSEITLQRVARASPLGGTDMVVEAEATVRAFVRPLGGGDRSEPLVGTVAQNDWLIILSPTDIVASGWESGSTVNPVVPIPGNRVATKVGALTVVAATPFYVADDLVRIELQARG